MPTALPVTLFNTLTRRIEKFTPLESGKIGLYCCGPTVYDYQHIGNFKTFLFEDLLVRMLRFSGYEVRHVMNITDVGHLVGDGDEGEDKMLVAARREKKRSFEIAEYYTNKFFEDWDKLNMARPTVVCKATDHIREMIELIQRLEKNGYTYVANGNVYFDVGKFPAYGQLAKLDLEKLKAGARIEVDANKRNPLDFVVWFTKSKFDDQEMRWESPWGSGYPGWHIECSAMSMRHLGEKFDIHCGGIDHIPVHHTNEIAQSEGATGQPWVSIWLHSEFMLINAEKMAKSKGKTILLDDIIEKGYDPLVFRYLCLGSHYRSHLNFTWEVLENCKHAYQKLRSAVLALQKEVGSNAPTLPMSSSHLDEFSAAVRDDINTPLALATVWAVIGERSYSAAQKLFQLYQFDAVLGLGMQAWRAEHVEIPEPVQHLMHQRDEARRTRNWSESDRLREAITQLGFEVQDLPQGTTVTKRS